MLPRYAGIQNLSVGKRRVDVLEGVFNQAHIPPALKRRVQCKNILVGSIHRPDNRQVGRNADFAATVAVNFNPNLTVGNVVFTRSGEVSNAVNGFWLKHSVEQLKNFAENRRGVSAIYFLND